MLFPKRTHSLKLRVFVWGLLCLLLGLLISVGWIFSQLRGGRTGEDFRFEIPRGAAAIRVLRQLQEHKAIKSVSSARLYLLLRQGEIHWGHYLIPRGSTPVQVLDQLIQGRVETLSITIIEGSPAEEIAKILSRAGVVMDQPWDAILHQVSLISDLAPTASTLEGFLFPETYQVDRGVTASMLVRHMIRTFRKVWEEETGASGAVHGRSIMDVVILASLVEGETGLQSERARIAGVYLNRLDRGMLLQCDPTVIYALRRKGLWRGSLSRRDLRINDPYNTYINPGLPPGPICNPGRAALRAALNPGRHHELYFVAKPGGGHTFSKTLKEHNRAVARYRRSRKKR